jgi:hypothetical protein
MTVYLASYDLRKPGRNYQTLYDRLADWKAMRVLESVWVMSTASSAVTLRDDLKKYIDANDGLLVVALGGEGAWSELIGQSGQALKKLLES